MIYFDVTRTSAARHHSGLLRVTHRLGAEFGSAVTPVRWDQRRWVKTDGGTPAAITSSDWVLTAELFSEAERPGFGDFVRARRCRLAGIFHDAIPLKLPHITWPRSVSRQAEYMKLLSGFDLVFGVSAASQRELAGFWRWQGVEPVGRLETVLWGADFAPGERRKPEPAAAKYRDRAPAVLCVGILEPRKNQSFLLDVCERLWSGGLAFDLHLVGRVNPHFGKPVLARIKALRRKYPHLHYHPSAGDDALRALYAQVDATAFPTLAEGCGLPVLESLWMALPCLCSDLPVLREIADGGGCVPVAPRDVPAWAAALRRMVTDAEWRETLQRKISKRELPTWAGAANRLRSALV
jgi:glycosyltransferase involved in cell wall biosynthesis